jgi:hypothetical protein
LEYIEYQGETNGDDNGHNNGDDKSPHDGLPELCAKVGDGVKG